MKKIIFSLAFIGVSIFAGYQYYQAEQYKEAYTISKAMFNESNNAFIKMTEEYLNLAEKFAEKFSALSEDDEGYVEIQNISDRIRGQLDSMKQ